MSKKSKSNYEKLLKNKFKNDILKITNIILITITYFVCFATKTQFIFVKLISTKSSGGHMENSAKKNTNLAEGGINYNDENERLAKLVAEGDMDARERLILNNMALVKKIANDFCITNTTMEDVLQAGYVGLIKAVDKYNIRKSKFSYWASIWIKKYIRMEIYRSHNIVSAPTEVIRISIALKTISNRLFDNLGRKPTRDEILEDADTQELLANKKFKESDLDLYLNLNHYYELESTISDSSDITFLDILEDTSIDYEESVLSQDLIKECLKSLSERERNIVKLYLGLDGEKPMTYMEISETIGISMQRVAIIYTNSIEKLRKRFIGKTENEFWKDL